MTIGNTLRLPYVFLLLFGLTVVLYYGSLYEIYVHPHAISLDDQQLMNDLINHDLTSGDLFSRPGAGKYYRPMLTLSYLVDQRISGTASFGYRLTNVILHAANVLLLFMIARILCKHEPMSEKIAFLSAVLFAIHPVAVESVSWISGRTDLLAVFWSLVSLLLYFSGRITRKWYLLLGSLLSAFAAVMSKESGLVVPVIIAVGELYFYANSVRRRMRISILFAILCAVLVIGYLVLRSMKLSTDDTSIRMIAQSLSGDGIGHTVRLLFASIGFYLKKFIYPYPLNVAINQINVLFYAVIGVVSLALFLIIALKKTIPSFLVFWALLGIAPAGMVSLTSIAWTPWAERYLYFSLAPLSILLVLAIFNRAYALNDKGRKVLFATGIGLLIIFAASSLYRSFLWNDNLRIWEDTYAKSPGFIYAATGYADALAEKGKTNEAEKVLLSAVELPGHKHVVYFRLGHVYREKSERGKAEEYYQSALAEARADKNLALVGPALRKDILLSLAGLYLSGANQNELDRVNYDKAIDKMIEAYTEYPTDSFLLYRIAKLYLLIEEEKHAGDYLKMFIAKGGGDSYIQTAKKMLEHIESKRKNSGTKSISS